MGAEAPGREGSCSRCTGHPSPDPLTGASLLPSLPQDLCQHGLHQEYHPGGSTRCQREKWGPSGDHGRPCLCLIQPKTSLTSWLCCPTTRGGARAFPAALGSPHGPQLLFLRPLPQSRLPRGESRTVGNWRHWALLPPRGDWVVVNSPKGGRGQAETWTLPQGPLPVPPSQAPDPLQQPRDSSTGPPAPTSQEARTPDILGKQAPARVPSLGRGGQQDRVPLPRPRPGPTSLLLPQGFGSRPH